MVYSWRHFERFFLTKYHPVHTPLQIYIYIILTYVYTLYSSITYAICDRCCHRQTGSLPRSYLMRRHVFARDQRISAAAATTANRIFIIESNMADWTPGPRMQITRANFREKKNRPEGSWRYTYIIGLFACESDFPFNAVSSRAR